MSLSARLTAAWYAGHPALDLLRPLEWMYRAVVQRKRARFLAGEGAIYRAPVPVVVVGNITVGGTGKTPMILWLIEHCRRQGLRVGVVSRGYGAQPPQLPWRVQADQAASVAGDEPLLIVQRSGVPLMIDPDRSRAVAALLAAEPLDLILSDDGLQHYRLARDLAAAERHHGVPETRPPEAGFAPIAHSWAAGEDLSVLLETDDELTAGDFVRNIKQLIDLLRQIAAVAPDPATARSARHGADAIHRGVVALSGSVEVA